MHPLLFTLIILITFSGMEFIAWFTHKFIMHGFMWTWHRSHHRLHSHPLERNDLFALVFSIPSVVTIYMGTSNPKFSYLFPFGLGILGYGLFYFVFHDVIVHRRIKINFRTNNPYLKRIINAHYVHHQKHSKEGGEAFGFLWAPKKYSKE